MQTFHKLLQNRAGSKPDQAIIHFQNKTYSNQWLYQTSVQFTQWLINEKIELLAFCLYNSPVNILSYLAGWMSGTHTLPINPRYTDYELAKLVQTYQPNTLLIESHRVTDLLQKACKESQTKIITVDEKDPMVGELWNDLETHSSIVIARKYDEAIQGKSEVLDRHATLTMMGNKVLNSAPSSMQTETPRRPRVGGDLINPLRAINGSNKIYTYHLTSGTTGLTKAVTHSLEHITIYAHNRAQDFGYQQDDKLLVTLSLNHAFAFSYQLLPALVLGLPLYLLPKFDEEEVFNAVLKHQITTLALLPTMAYQLSLYASQQLKKSHCLRYPLVAGDALPQAFQEHFQKTFGVPLYQGIGMTEVFGYAQNPPTSKNKASVKLFDSTQLEIRNDQGEVLPIGRVGHVFLQNEATPLSYFKADKDLNSDLKEGWVRTGDLGYVDQERYFHFLGRSKNIIIRGGSNILPAEIEAALYQHPSVLKAAVVGKKDEFWREVPIAYVELLSYQVIESDLLQHCRERLAEYKLPESLIILDKMPLNATGKVDRDRLGKLLVMTGILK